MLGNAPGSEMSKSNVKVRESQSFRSLVMRVIGSKVDESWSGVGQRRVEQTVISDPSPFISRPAAGSHLH